MRKRSLASLRWNSLKDVGQESFQKQMEMWTEWTVQSHQTAKK